MSTFVYCRAVWADKEQQQYLTGKQGRDQKYKDRHMDGGKGENTGQIDEQSYMYTRNRRTKKSLLFCFTSPMEHTRVIGARELVLYQSH